MHDDYTQVLPANSCNPAEPTKAPGTESYRTSGIRVNHCGQATGHEAESRAETGQTMSFLRSLETAVELTPHAAAYLVTLP